MIAIVKPIAADCTSCYTPYTNVPANLPPNAVPVNTTIISDGIGGKTGCATMTFVCPEGSLVQINGAIFNYDLIAHTFDCLSYFGGTYYYGFYSELYSIFYDEYYNYDFIEFIQCFTLRKLNSNNHGHLPTFSVQSINLSAIADSIRRRQSESVRSIASPHLHLHKFSLHRKSLKLYRDLSLLSTSFIHSL